MKFIKTIVGSRYPRTRMGLGTFTTPTFFMELGHIITTTSYRELRHTSAPTSSVIEFNKVIQSDHDSYKIDCDTDVNIEVAFKVLQKI